MNIHIRINATSQRREFVLKIT